MNYESLINDIVTRLLPLAATLDIEVQALADNEENYTEPFAKARITVAYKSSAFSPTIVRGLPESVSTNEYVGNEYATVQVGFQARLLYGNSGAYNIIFEAKKLLYGYMPTHWGRLHPAVFELEKNEKGVWTCVMDFTTNCLAVQAETDDAGTDYPDLAGVTVNINIE